MSALPYFEAVISATPAPYIKETINTKEKVGEEVES